MGSKALQGVCVLGHLSNDWASAAIWLLAPAIGLALELRPSEIGLLLTIHSIGASLAYFPAGILADQGFDLRSKEAKAKWEKASSESVRRGFASFVSTLK